MPRYIVDRSRDVRILKAIEFDAENDADAVERGKKLLAGEGDSLVLFGTYDWQVNSVDPMDDDDEHVTVTANAGEKLLFDSAEENDA
jgi:hypothetical protein